MSVMSDITRLARMALSCALLLGGSTLHAAMQLDRTRLVVHEDEGSAVIQVRSKDALPLLLQVWVDQHADTRQQDGVASVAVSDIPFITDPPVVRLEPGSTRAVQVLLTHVPETLPTDRESLYWLNILEVPTTLAANASRTDASRLHMGFQSQLKLFYRPKALNNYTDVSAVNDADRLRFTLTHDASHRAWLSIHNPAPIHQSLATLTVRPLVAGAASLKLDAPTVAPFEDVRLPLPSSMGSEEKKHLRLTFATIDDHGELMPDEQTL